MAPLTRQDVFNDLTKKALLSYKQSDVQDRAAALAFKKDIDVSIAKFIALARDELITCLTQLDPLAPQLGATVEYKFIGPEHKVGDISKRLDWIDLMTLQDKHLSHTDPSAELPDDQLNESDQCFKCAICMEMYTDVDAPIKLNACKHIVGEECMASWLTSTATPNCPYCRTQLCKPRQKRPKEQTLTGKEEQQFRILNFRMGSIVTQIHDVCRITQQLHPESRKDRHLFDAFKLEVNMILKEKKLGYLLSPRMEGYQLDFGSNNILDGSRELDGFDALFWQFKILRVSWNLDGSLNALSEGYELVGPSGGV